MRRYLVPVAVVVLIALVGCAPEGNQRVVVLEQKNAELAAQNNMLQVRLAKAESRTEAAVQSRQKLHDLFSNYIEQKGKNQIRSTITTQVLSERRQELKNAITQRARAKQQEVARTGTPNVGQESVQVLLRKVVELRKQLADAEQAFAKAQIQKAKQENQAGRGTIVPPQSTPQQGDRTQRTTR